LERQGHNCKLAASKQLGPRTEQLDRIEDSWIQAVTHVVLHQLCSCPGLQQEKASLSLNHGLVHLGTFHTRVALSASGQILAGLLGLGTVFNFCQISHRVELHFFLVIMKR